MTEVPARNRSHVRVLARPRLFGFPGAAGLFDLAWSTLAARLAEWAETELEQRRLFPWVAVCFALGIMLFFAAEGRPSLWAPATGAALTGAAAIWRRGRVVSHALLVAVAAVFAGFGAGVIRTEAVEAPALRQVLIAPVSGFIESVEERDTGARFVVRVHELGALPAGERPRSIRLTVASAAGLAPGLFVVGRARILPPPEAARPGGYDFAREAYFRGLGGVGSVLGVIRAQPAPVAAPLDLRVAAAIDSARNTVARRIAAVIGGQAGAVAAALVTGKRGLISEETNEALRAAGLYHIISISGLHMALASAILFWTARAGLALAPAMALRWPCKKIAAVAAMAGATAYCVFSGSEVATERSLVMTLVMLGAILVDRPALSMRNLSLAALIVLALQPETLLGPSFQMSFAAVAGLIAAAEWWHHRASAAHPLGGALGRGLRWARNALLGIGATTIIASLATAPFGIYHFQVANPLGLIGNALALPLVSLVVMPAAVLGALAYPFGLDKPVWTVMGVAVDGVLQVSAWVQTFAGSTLVAPAFGGGGLALIALGLVVLTVFATPLRWLALVPAAAGLALASFPVKPDLYVDREGAGAAVRGPDGRLAVLGRPSDFILEQWLRADGDARATNDSSLKAGTLCDPLGCVASATPGGAVSYVRDRRAFAEDCARAGVIVTRLVAPAGCAAALVIDRNFLNRHGATAVLWSEAGRRVITARHPDEDRPWSRHPPESRPRAAGTRPASPKPDGNPAELPSDPSPQ